MRLLRKVKTTAPSPPRTPETHVVAIYQSTKHPEWYAMFLCTRGSPERPYMVDGSESWKELYRE